MYLSINLEYDFFYILLFIIFNITGNLLEKLLGMEYETNNLIKHVSLIILIIFYFIEKCFLKSVGKEEFLKNNYTLFNKKNLKIFILILCFLILYVIAKIIVEKLMKENIFNVDIFFQIPFLIFLNKIIYKKKFYSHHLFSMLFNGILSVLILFLYFNKLKKFYTSTIFLLIDCYTYSFYLIIIKFLNYKYYISIYILGNLVGIGGFIYCIIINFKRNIDLTKNEFYKMLLLFFNYIFYQYLYFAIILKYSPNHAVIGECISMIIITIFFDDKMTKEYIIIIFSFLYLIFIMIYLEIIELKFCNLNKNLKNKIKSRGQNELTQDFSDIQNISNLDSNENDLDLFASHTTNI